MENENSIFGCFMSISSDPNLSDQGRLDFSKKVRAYIWGDKGINDIFKKLKYEDYGTDLELALFQFYVKPIPYLLQHLKEIETYRKKEKAIGIPICIVPKLLSRRICNDYNISNRACILSKNFHYRISPISMFPSDGR